MNIRAIKTHSITPTDTDLIKVIDQYVTSLSDGSILAVTSKIVSICEGQVVPIEGNDKDELIKKEAEWYLPRSMSKYNFLLTIKNQLLIPSAGIDESNAKGVYVLWPKNPQASANKIREYLSKKFRVKNFGVVITDSKSAPLRWGVTGAGVAHSGFIALNDLRGEKDIFGRELKVTQVNVMDALTAAAVYVMGESSNQTPLALLTDIPHIQFQDRNPTDEELNAMKIDIEDDLYAPLLKSVEWKKT